MRETTIRRVTGGIIGLFVDDGIFAVAILVWVGVVALALPHLNVARDWSGVVLFAGLAVILVESSWRRTTCQVDSQGSRR
jgi:membrane protein implicated in regulation of membrane protease activity